MILETNVNLALANQRFSFHRGQRWEIYIYSILEGHTDTVTSKKWSVNSKMTELRQCDCLGC